MLQPSAILVTALLIAGSAANHGVSAREQASAAAVKGPLVASNLFPVREAASGGGGRKSSASDEAAAAAERMRARQEVLGSVSARERDEVLDRFLFGNPHLSQASRADAQTPAQKPGMVYEAQPRVEVGKAKGKGKQPAAASAQGRRQSSAVGTAGKVQSKARYEVDDEHDDDLDDDDDDDDDDEDDEEDEHESRWARLRRRRSRSRSRRQRRRASTSSTEAYGTSPSAQSTASYVWSLSTYLFFLLGAQLVSASSTSLVVARYVLRPPINLGLRAASACFSSIYAASHALLLHSLRPLRVLVVAPIAYLVLGFYHLFLEVPLRVLGALAAELYPLYLFLGAATTLGLGLGLGAAVVLLCGSMLFSEGSAFERVFQRKRNGEWEEVDGAAKRRSGRRGSKGHANGADRGKDADVVKRRRRRSLIGRAMQDIRRSGDFSGFDAAQYGREEEEERKAGGTPRAAASREGKRSPPSGGMWSEEDESWAEQPQQRERRRSSDAKGASSAYAHPSWLAGQWAPSRGSESGEKPKERTEQQSHMQQQQQQQQRQQQSQVHQQQQHSQQQQHTGGIAPSRRRSSSGGSSSGAGGITSAAYGSTPPAYPSPSSWQRVPHQTPAAPMRRGSSGGGGSGGGGGGGAGLSISTSSSARSSAANSPVDMRFAGPPGATGRAGWSGGGGTVGAGSSSGKGSGGGYNPYFAE